MEEFIGYQGILPQVFLKFVIAAEKKLQLLLYLNLVCFV
jgi:hypothetical protein